MSVVFLIAPSKLAQAANCNQNVACSNTCRDTNYFSLDLRGIPQPVQANSGIVGYNAESHNHFHILPQHLIIRQYGINWNLLKRSLNTLQVNKNNNTFISTKSPSFAMTTFSVRLRNFTALLPQTHDCSCYVSRPILAPPPLWLHKGTDLRAHEFRQPPALWHQPKFANISCARSWKICRINPAIFQAGTPSVLASSFRKVSDSCFVLIDYNSF